MLFLFIWQDAQHQNMDIEQRAGLRHVPYAAASTAATMVIAMITVRTITRPIPCQYVVEAVEAAVAEAAEV